MKVLVSQTVQKPWGRQILPLPFVSPPGQRIGEIWFTPPSDMPDILVKYIFTSEKLSVQVHPSADQAAALGEKDGGKEECWLVISADPGAKLGIGFTEPVEPEAMRRAALDGSIADMMQWFEVQPGDFFYIPAGTVHAIGAGIGLIEIQQNSDITYRLYDYGRPRDLHLDQGIGVAKGEVYVHAQDQNSPGRVSGMLADSPYFRLYSLDGNSASDSAPSGDALVIPVTHSAFIDGSEVSVGQVAFTQSVQSVQVKQDGACLLVQRP